MTDVPSITSSPFSPRIGRLRPSHLREFVFLFLLSPPIRSIRSFSPSSLSLSPTRGFFLCSLLSYPVLISSLCLSSMNRGETTTYRGPTDHSRSRDTRMTALFPFQLSLSLSLPFALEEFRRIENARRKLEDNSYISRRSKERRGFGSTRGTPVYIYSVSGE